MRSIPAALKAKLAAQYKARGMDNEPRLRLVATQNAYNTLITEPIHEDISPAFGDVTIRQLEGESDPSRAYAICLDNGTATIWQRELPAFYDYPWQRQWVLGSAADVAIEYDGTWVLSDTKEHHYLRTEQYPYVFFADASGNLYVQKWTDESTRMFLASNASNISACRGWQSTDDPEIDQGLIIGYLRDGKVYYRALCYEAEAQTTVWEAEHQVTELGTGNTTLAVFRTNDFRVGFLTQHGGEMLMALTGRSYAGQSVLPESVYGQVVPRCTITPTPIKYLTGYGENGRIGAAVNPGDCYIGCFKAEAVCSIVSCERTSAAQITISFDRPLLLRKPIEEYLTVTQPTGTGTDTTGNLICAAAVSGNDLILTTEELSPYRPVNVRFYAWSNLCFFPGADSSPQPVDPFAIELDAVIYGKADSESVRAVISLTALVSTPIKYLEQEYDESGSINVTIPRPTLEVTKVGDVPV